MLTQPGYIGRVAGAISGARAAWFDLPSADKAAHYDSAYGAGVATGINVWEDARGDTENLISSPTDLSQPAWVPVRCTTPTANTIIVDGSNNTHFVRQQPVMNGDKQTVVVEATAGAYTFLRIGMTDSGGAARNAYFDLSLGVVGSASATVVSAIVDLGGGRYKCIASLPTSKVGASDTQIAPAPADATISWLGDGVSGITVHSVKSYYGTPLLQATAASQPALGTDAQGRPIITFDGVDDFLKTAAFTLNQPETIYLVCKQVTWTANDYLLDGLAATSGAILQHNSSPRVRSYAGAFSGLDSNLAIGTTGIITNVFNGASSVFKTDKNADITGNFGANNMGGLTLGAQGGGLNFWSNIDVYELIIYSVAHTAAERDYIISGLMAKYGVA